MPEARSLNLELLIKLLKLTTSSNDSEALLAARKANEVLMKFGGDWDALLRGKVTVIADPFSAPAPTADQIRRSSGPPPAAPARPYAKPKPAQNTYKPNPAYQQPRFQCVDGCGRTVGAQGAQCSICSAHAIQQKVRAAAQAAQPQTKAQARKQRLTLDDIA